MNDYLRRKFLDSRQYVEPSVMEDMSDSGWTSEEVSLSGLDDEGFEDYDGMDIVDDILSPYGK